VVLYQKGAFIVNVKDAMVMKNIGSSNLGIGRTLRGREPWTGIYDPGAKWCPKVVGR